MKNIQLLYFVTSLIQLCILKINLPYVFCKNFGVQEADEPNPFFKKLYGQLPTPVPTNEQMRKSRFIRLKSLSYICLFLFMSLQSVDQQILSTTVFTPVPLLEFDQTNISDSYYLVSIKQVAIPLACCLCLAIKKNDIWTDIMQNPLAASMCIYAIMHYYVYLMIEKQQKKIDQDIITMMQHVFHLLIIGHGIYNKMSLSSFEQQKASPIVNVSNVNMLELFLCNAYQTWLILFSYYQERYKDKPLYVYHMDQVDIFEILQAADREPEVLPLIIQIYDKKNIICDYEAIITYLENKLKQINNKLQTILPT